MGRRCWLSFKGKAKSEGRKFDGDVGEWLSPIPWCVWSTFPAALENIDSRDGSPAILVELDAERDEGVVGVAGPAVEPCVCVVLAELDDRLLCNPGACTAAKN